MQFKLCVPCTMVSPSPYVRFLDLYIFTSITKHLKVQHCLHTLSNVVSCPHVHSPVLLEKFPRTLCFSKATMYTTLLNFLIFITGFCRGYPLVILIELNAYIGFFHAHIFLSVLFVVHMYTYLMYIPPPPPKNLSQFYRHVQMNNVHLYLPSILFSCCPYGH